MKQNTSKYFVIYHFKLFKLKKYMDYAWSIHCNDSYGYGHTHSELWFIFWCAKWIITIKGSMQIYHMQTWDFCKWDYYILQRNICCAFKKEWIWHTCWEIIHDFFLSILWTMSYSLKRQFLPWKKGQMCLLMRAIHISFRDKDPSSWQQVFK